LQYVSAGLLGVLTRSDLRQAAEVQAAPLELMNVRTSEALIALVL